MYQYTRSSNMHTAIHRVGRIAFVLALAMMNGCAVTEHRIAAEVAVPVDSGDDEAQYAISTRQGRTGRIVIPVTINGQPNFRLMLDTGATHSVLTSNAAARLGLDITQAEQSEVQGVSGRIRAPIMNVKQLQAGTLKLKDLRVPVIDGAVVSGLDGILGVEGFDSKVVTADFMHDRIRVADASSMPATNMYATVRFTLVSHRLVVVDGMVGRIPVRAVIDTGGNQTLGNLALLEALQKAKNEQISTDSGVIDITDKTQNGRLLLIPEVKIGAANISNCAILFSDFNVFNIWKMDKRPTLLIGMDVLGQLGELSINYRRQELQVRSR
jgi:clan AA aspartic protease (TIGR02281 family)